MAERIMRIPFNKPFIAGKELYYVAQAVVEAHLSGNGPFSKRCQAWLEENLGCSKALLTHSCTAALEMAAILADIKPGDEVIMPSFTFVSTANAFVLRGGVPVFVDIRRDTLNLDEHLIEAAITDRTKAIVPVHYAGVACAMGAILDIAARFNLMVVEDAAQALLSRYRDKKLGTIGHLGCLSFHETKNIISGEGGALLINDERFRERAEIIWEKGTDRSKFFRGEVDKYTWVDIGSSYLPSDMLAAFLFAQLEAHAQLQSKRKKIWEKYHTNLKQWAQGSGSILPTIPDHVEQPYHMYYLLLPSLTFRQGLIAHLKERSILSVFHYLPLHTSEMGKRFGAKPGDCPVTEDISDRLLRLPFYADLEPDDQDKVIQAIIDYNRD